MAVAGCPDYFLHHPNYQQDNRDRSNNHRQANLIGPGFQQSTDHNSPNHQEDDLDLEALVNDMNSSLESLYSTSSAQQTESTSLLQNGQTSTSSQQPHNHHRPNTHHAQLQQGHHLLSHSSHEPPSSASIDLPQASLCRSQPMHILAVRRLREEQQQLRTSSLPAIPNPFPELCSLASSPVLSPGSLPPREPSTGIYIVKISTEDGMGKVVEIPADMTARDLCQLLVYKSHCVDDNSWALVEHHPLLGLERCLEDHELVVQVQASMSSDGRFLFRKNYAKYEFFRTPQTFFPEHMFAWCQESNRPIPPSQLLQNFLATSSCPEIQGYLYVKEVGRKSWKKVYMFLRRSGLYCSTKGTSKEPRHLHLLADLEDSNIFTVITGKKQHGAPTDFEFCIKPNKCRGELKDLRILCAEDEQGRTCWMTAFRLFKYGILLYQNYKIPQQRKTLLSHFSAPVRSVSENSLVAMDFSGTIGRVIDNPVEAQSAAMEEGHAWRKRNHRMNILGSHSPLHHSSLNSVIHMAQLWFHGRITREESHRIIHQQGQVDGLFLLRVSQSNPKAFVLTLCHHQKIKHFQILPCEEDGQVFFSLDDGATKFTDLIQLVEFYQLNRGVLPCKLKHPCTFVAL
ncbi:growth factor receptor-bound protein 10 isoform X1 [Syngnathus scovelli]|uniref:growth factor receptor-bound protein 10 isoform X1 n=1 Tax=Syngnathus scovelli TaxID=161590 RepID=UPI0021108DBF|nr:growth factor receptor-bound protein 10 isoform X1 [Syngnathus scovelli]XP_049586548.1 growth factor receptor-bound protein 10 isoform X1 [Syngnathus scovelli]